MRNRSCRPWRPAGAIHTHHCRRWCWGCSRVVWRSLTVLSGKSGALTAVVGCCSNASTRSKSASDWPSDRTLSSLSMLIVVGVSWARSSGEVQGSVRSDTDQFAQTLLSCHSRLLLTSFGAQPQAFCACVMAAWQLHYIAALTLSPLTSTLVGIKSTAICSCLEIKWAHRMMKERREFLQMQRR